MIIGRLSEQSKLSKVYNSNNAEFVAIYGRRRVGKTYLVRQFFNTKDGYFFQTSGIHKGSVKLQLGKFKQEIEQTFYQRKSGVTLAPFRSWHDAFQALTDAIEIFAANKKIVVFLDEAPWMATHKSGFVEALDYYWNRYWSDNPNFKLIICGSAASWIIKNILGDAGGLHNRVTLRLRIEPFTLQETKQYLAYRKISYGYEQIINLYMCIGGIPFYLSSVEKGLSAIQNINQMCFLDTGALYNEFNLLFASLFKQHKLNQEIITFIAKSRYGVSRKAIEAKFFIKGGRLTERLRELEEAGFIRLYTHAQSIRGIYYQVIDEYSLFYLTWIYPKSSTKIQEVNSTYWNNLANTTAWKIWAGYAFETICYKHIQQIKDKLNIPDCTIIYNWRYKGKIDKYNTQVDLIFDRNDGIVNICEIKYLSVPMEIDKNYAAKLLIREQAFLDIMGSRKQVFHSFITAHGIKPNVYSEDMIASEVTLSDLFAEHKTMTIDNLVT